MLEGGGVGRERNFFRYNFQIITVTKKLPISNNFKKLKESNYCGI